VRFGLEGFSLEGEFWGIFDVLCFGGLGGKALLLSALNDSGISGGFLGRR